MACQHRSVGILGHGKFIFRPGVFFDPLHQSPPARERNLRHGTAVTDRHAETGGCRPSTFLPLMNTEQPGCDTPRRRLLRSKRIEVSTIWLAAGRGVYLGATDESAKRYCEQCRIIKPFGLSQESSSVNLLSNFSKG